MKLHVKPKLVVAAIALVWPSLANAHPHVWVEMQSKLVFTTDGKIEGVNVKWTFDDVYAAEALDGMDANGDGEYSQEELVPLTAENIDALKAYGYFTVMRADGKQLEAAPPTRAGQSYTDKKLQLHFEVPLKAPYDPHKGEFVLKIYDPEFFIAFDYVKKQPVATEGNVPDGCKMTIKPVPTDAETDQTLAMLSTKGKDWQPENGEDFGSMFAQPVAVSCN